MPTTTLVPEISLGVESRRLVLAGLSRSGAWFLVMIGAMALAGWAFDLDVLNSIVPDWPSMKPNTAVCVFTVGLVLLLGITKHQVASVLLTLAFSLIGALSLVEDLFGMELGLDRILFRQSVDDAGEFHPGRMFSTTALALLLMGLAILLARRGRRLALRISAYMGFVVILLGFTGLLGYALGIASLYSPAAFVPMSLNSALALVVGGVAVLLWNPEGSWPKALEGDGVGAALVRRLLPWAVGGPILSGILVLAGQRLGLYAEEYRLFLFVLVILAIFAGIVIHTAKFLDTQDITRRSEQTKLGVSEAETKNQTRLLKLILESVGEGIVVTDSQGKFTLFNAAAEHILEKAKTLEPVDQWPGIYGLYLPDGTTPYPAHQLPIARALRGESVDDDLEMIRHSGKPDGAWISVNARGLRNESGTQLGAVAVFRDISVRVRAEEALKRSNQELEQFAYVASHDLQEPLRMVSSFTKLLQSRYGGKLGAEADTYINFAVDGAVRMRLLIQGLLEFSRVNSSERVEEPVETGWVVRQAMENLAKSIKESDADVIVGDLPRVRGDRIQLGQVFQNLIGNALKFRADRKPRVDISAEFKDGIWTFRVKDNGIGFQPEYAEKIFVIFQRLHAMDRYPGTGIGLAVCKRIVERYGGKIWVESEPGVGSTFFFTLSRTKELA